MAGTVCVLLLTPALRLDSEEVVEATRLKAAVVSRLPHFVDWPSTSRAGEGTFDLCVLLPDPFGPTLNELLDGEVLRSRPVVIRHVRWTSSLDGCHLLYLPAAAARRRAVLRRAASRPILTVGDAPRFLDEGGIVQLRLVDNRVRFDVSTAAADRAGLRISSQLLQLAASIRGVTS